MSTVSLSHSVRAPPPPQNESKLFHFIVHNTLVNYYHRDATGRIRVWDDRAAATAEVTLLNQSFHSEVHQVLSMAEEKWAIFKREMFYEVVRTNGSLEVGEKNVTKQEDRILVHASGQKSPFTAFLQKEVKLAKRPQHAEKIVILPGVTSSKFHEAMELDLRTKRAFDPNVIFQKLGGEKALYIHHKDLGYNARMHQLYFLCPLDFLESKDPLPATTMVMLLDADTGIPLCLEWTLDQFKVPARRCAFCRQVPAKQTEGSLSRCSACKLLPYCGKECQRKHWKAGHKRSCERIRGLQDKLFEEPAPLSSYVTAGLKTN
eukprot:gb/GEZN01006932.1/.p1 GENE.gb/GEZN01006932.1/~~gb/GEZN01006932.1/.p1  ORF type:complete len:345 (-),score=35.95 gb/GEZN01006932.1/:567-1520(-)